MSLLVAQTFYEKEIHENPYEHTCTWALKEADNPPRSSPTPTTVLCTTQSDITPISSGTHVQKKTSEGPRTREGAHVGYRFAKIYGVSKICYSVPEAFFLFGCYNICNLKS